MARSLWKGPFIDTFLIRNSKQANQNSLTNSLNISPKKKSLGETKELRSLAKQISLKHSQWKKSRFILCQV